MTKHDRINSMFLSVPMPFELRQKILETFEIEIINKASKSYFGSIKQPKDIGQHFWDKCIEFKKKYDQINKNKENL